VEVATSSTDHSPAPAFENRGFRLTAGDFQPGDSADVMGLLMRRTGGVKIAARHDAITDEYLLAAGHGKAATLSRKAAHLYLLSQAGIPADQALEALEKIASGTKSFMVIPREGIEKKAYMTQMDPEPGFLDPMENDYGVLQDQTQGFALGSVTPQVARPIPAFGDMMNPGNPAGVGGDFQSGSKDGAPEDLVLRLDPEQLAATAKRLKMPNVFEHGVIGNLSKTFDPLSMIERYLPSIEDGLDNIGRILFLYYWKPKDFEAAYGSDDMESLENDLLSVFRGMGDLVLDLLKRSRSRDQSTGSRPMGDRG